MKKITFFIGLTIILMNFKANGQESRIAIGIKAGVNYSDYFLNKKFKDVSEISGEIGYYGGMFINYELSENYKLHSELLFLLQGKTSTVIYYGFKHKNLEKTIVLPFLIQYHNKKNMYFELGPSFAYVIDNNVTIIQPVNDFQFDDSDYERFDLSVSLGLGYKINDKTAISIRYSLGLIERLDSKSSILNLGLEYKI